MRVSLSYIEKKSYCDNIKEKYYLTQFHKYLTIFIKLK